MDFPEAARRAQQLMAEGRSDDALALHNEIMEAFPGNSVAHFNRAAALCDLGRWLQSRADIRTAMAMGLDAPDAWLILGRNEQGIGDLEAAERAFTEALRRHPVFVEAHKDLAQLRWMRDGDVGSVLKDIDTALAASGSLRLLVVKYQILSEAGRVDEALALLLAALPRAPADGVLATLIAQAAKAVGDYQLALQHAKRARAAVPESPAAFAILVEALLASGRPEEASAAADDFLALAPGDQQALALQATAWRALGDSRYRDLYNFDAFLGIETLETPPGWQSLEAYLADLRVALLQAHHFRTHPFGQSIRHGSQAPSIDYWPHPATQALRVALDAPIRRYLAKLGAGDTPVQTRNTGRYRFQGMWSIRMLAGGRHSNHVHPQGWLSSACYVETPVVASGREGWLKLGEPDLATPALPPERFVEPMPGRLVLFPSYMWHGTVPFSGAGARMTFAFDLVPA